MSVELTSACSLWASPSRAELTALGSMTVLDEAGRSAAGGGAEVPNGVFVQLILAPLRLPKRAVFACSVDRLAGWESTQRFYYTN